MFFLDQNRGWVITWRFDDSSTYLFSTAGWWEKLDAQVLSPSFQGKHNWASTVRFLSERIGFVIARDERVSQNNLIYTMDGGTHWHTQPMAHFAYGCQVFDGDLFVQRRVAAGIPDLDGASEIAAKKSRLDRRLQPGLAALPAAWNQEESLNRDLGASGRSIVRSWKPDGQFVELLNHRLRRDFEAQCLNLLLIHRAAA